MRRVSLSLFGLKENVDSDDGCAILISGLLKTEREKLMELINLTPHIIVLRSEDGKDTVLESTGRAILVTEPGEIEWMDGVPVPIQNPQRIIGIKGLPAPEEGVMYITSMVVAVEAAKRGRMDVLSPGTGPNDGAVRDEQGRIVAVTRLNRQG